MKYAIETLEAELENLNTPIEDDDEEDLVGAVIQFRKRNHLKLAIKLLKQMEDSAKEINMAV